MSELMLIEPKPGRAGQEWYWRVESVEKLAEVFERMPAAAEWCRKDADNMEALLEAVEELEGDEYELAGAMEEMFLEAERAGIGAEMFAGAVCKVLAGGGAGVPPAKAWQDAAPPEPCPPAGGAAPSRAALARETVETWRRARHVAIWRRRRESHEWRPWIEEGRRLAKVLVNVQERLVGILAHAKDRCETSLCMVLARHGAERQARENSSSETNERSQTWN